MLRPITPVPMNAIADMVCDSGKERNGSRMQTTRPGARDENLRSWCHGTAGETRIVSRTAAKPPMTGFKSIERQFSMCGLLHHKAHLGARPVELKFQI